MSAPWGFLPPSMRDQLQRQLNWKKYLASARSLGYTEREARLVAAGVLQVAKKIPHEVDILDEAREVLATADLPAPEPKLNTFDVDSAESARLNGMTYP